MKQNLYDDPIFFERYMAYRRNPLCLNNTVEQPALLANLPNLQGKRVLDIGCGSGGFCRTALALGAKVVVGLDISRRMCAEAESTLKGMSARIINAAVEDYEDDGLYDIVVSSLAIHYVDDYLGTLTKIYRWLTVGGIFVFSVNHPIYTSDLVHVPDFGSGREPHSAVNCYEDEGVRQHYWFVDGVVKYHRRMETYVNSLVAQGFRVCRLLEPVPRVEYQDAIPELRAASRRPVFVVIAAEKVAPNAW